MARPRLTRALAALTMIAGTLIAAQSSTPAAAAPTKVAPAVVPMAVPSVKAKQIASGAFHSCALTVENRLRCWGANTYGQLGNRTTANALTPVGTYGLTKVKAITAGAYHTCALTTDGKVWCWGTNSRGELGNGTTTNASKPVQVTGLKAKSISGGTSHTCAVTTSGKAKCWGYNLNGQLGNGTTTDSSVPVQVSGLTKKIKSIAAGGYHSCAVTTSGKVKCWGSNSQGQLGNNKTVSSRTPVSVYKLAASTVVKAGLHTTCAITKKAAAKCWGLGIWGQLGNGKSANSAKPVGVSGMSKKVKKIAIGVSHGCAVLTTGTVKCWGDNFNGQLGNRTTTSTTVPVTVFGLSKSAKAISTGTSSSCAITKAGAAKCWGYGALGSLGYGGTADQLAPVAVSKLN